MGGSWGVHLSSWGCHRPTRGGHTITLPPLFPPHPGRAPRSPLWAAERGLRGRGRGCGRGRGVASGGGGVATGFGGVAAAGMGRCHRGRSVAARDRGVATGGRVLPPAGPAQAEEEQEAEPAREEAGQAAGRGQQLEHEVAAGHQRHPEPVLPAAAQRQPHQGLLNHVLVGVAVGLADLRGLFQP